MVDRTDAISSADVFQKSMSQQFQRSIKMVDNLNTRLKGANNNLDKNMTKLKEALLKQNEKAVKYEKAKCDLNIIEMKLTKSLEKHSRMTEVMKILRRKELELTDKIYEEHNQRASHMVNYEATMTIIKTNFLKVRDALALIITSQVNDHHDAEIKEIDSNLGFCREERRRLLNDVKLLENQLESKNREQQCLLADVKMALDMFKEAYAKTK